MTDETEKTQPNIADRYKEAESWFDAVVITLLKSPLTLGAFVVWTLCAVLFGWWAGR